jgi:hypothetical protein
MVTFMTYSDLYQILLEAEARRDNAGLPDAVRFRSGISAELAAERMRREGLTRDRLRELAMVDRS